MGARGEIYDGSSFAYQAAVEGQGIAIAQEELIRDELNKGQLTLPFQHRLDLGAFTYYLVYSEKAVMWPELKVFTQWLVSQSSKEPIATRDPRD